MYGPRSPIQPICRVEVPAGGQDDAAVRGDDPVAAERREVDAVVEVLAVDDAASPTAIGPNGRVRRRVRQRPR